MRRFFLLAFVFSLALSCNFMQKVKDTASEFFGDEVVAKVGDRKLYRSQLDAYIPDGVSKEDSTALAMQFINTWATDLVFLDVAESELSKEEKDVTKELEEYRISLLKYRYEQLYINSRLDTNITQDAIREYYEAHPDKFILDSPLVKVRFMQIPEHSSSLEKIKKKMSSKKVDDVIEADSLAFKAALKYADRSEEWMDILFLCREFGTDTQTLLSSMRNGFIQVPDGHGNLYVAYVVDMVREGKRAPLEYCAGSVKDIILSARKHALVSGLERDLLMDARNRERFVIY